MTFMPSAKAVEAAEGSSSTSTRPSSTSVESEAPPSYDALSIRHDAQPTTSTIPDFHFIRPQPSHPTPRPQTLLIPNGNVSPTVQLNATLDRHSSYIPPPTHTRHSSLSPNLPSRSAPPHASRHARPSSYSSQSYPAAEKPPPHAQAGPSSPPLSRRSASSPHIAPVFTPKKRGWFGGKAKTAKEAREWVIGHINDLVRQTHSYDLDKCRSVLEGCSEACTVTSQLWLADILQEKLIDDHTPFYWAIVHRPPSSHSGVVPDLLAALLTFGSPLTDATRADIRHACLMVNDQKLFQHLRCSTQFKFLPPPKSQVLVNNGKPPIDEIEVEEIPGTEPLFKVDLEIPQFVRRMHLEEVVEVEWIAHRRAWRLLFKPSPKSKPSFPSWDLSLSLSEQSSQTYVDSQFSILDTSFMRPKLPPKTSDKDKDKARHPNGDGLAVPGPSQNHGRLASPSMPNLSQSSSRPRTNPNPNRASEPQTVATRSGNKKRLRSHSQNALQHQPQPPIIVRLKSYSMIAHSPKKRDLGGITVSLEEGCGIGPAIRLQKSSYIGPNDTLKARLEARLAKPASESSCIIC